MVALLFFAVAAVALVVGTAQAFRRRWNRFRAGLFIAIFAAAFALLCSEMQSATSEPVAVRETATTDLVKVSDVYLTADIERRDAVYTYFVEAEDGTVQEQSVDRDNASIRISDAATVVTVQQEYPAGIFFPWPTAGADAYVFNIPEDGLAR